MTQEKQVSDISTETEPTGTESSATSTSTSSTSTSSTSTSETESSATSTSATSTSGTEIKPTMTMLQKQTPTAQLNAATALKILKATISDYNFWGESESDSPLSVKRTRTELTEKQILSLDAKMRAKATEVSGYKPPQRKLRILSLYEVFARLIADSLLALQDSAEQVKAGITTLDSLELPAEALEFYVQLYSCFSKLGNSQVYYVEDDMNDPYTGLFIIGKSTDGETIYAQTLLVQT